MAGQLDVCRFTPTAGSTTDFTYSSAIVGYQSPTAAGVVNGRLYKYRAESADLSQWEVGEGAYNTATGVLARTTVLFNSAGTTTKINFTLVPSVAVVLLKEDLISIEEANSFTSTQQGQARNNIKAAGLVNITKFTASGTYTVPANLLYAIVEVVGGGGSGGGVVAATPNYLSSGGGGAGGYARANLSKSQLGSSVTVTIGAGGAAPAAGNNAGNAGGSTTFVASGPTTLCAAGGGAGGQPTSATTGVGGGATPGGGTTGDILISGGVGGGGFGSSSTTIQAFYTGNGGQSCLSGSVIPASGNSPGTAGANYGGGGSGATSADANARAGGAGASGIVIITEFLSS